MACTNGSRKKASAPNFAWVSTSYGQGDIVSNIMNRLRFQPSFYMGNIPGFCQSPAPVVQDFTPADFLNLPGLFAKMVSNAQALYWYDVCECIPDPEEPPTGQCSVTVNARQAQMGVQNIPFTVTETVPGYEGAVVTVGLGGFVANLGGVPHYWIAVSVDGVVVNPEFSGNAVSSITSFSYSCTGGQTTPDAPPPPVLPPDLPVPPDPMNCLDDADKAELLAAINDCKCDTKLDLILAALATLGAALAAFAIVLLKALGIAKAADVADTAEDLVETLDELVDRPENSPTKLENKIVVSIEGAIPVYLMVRISISMYPGNISMYGSAEQRPVLKLGWIVFVLDDVVSERQFINFEKQAFISPFPGEDVTYEVYYSLGVIGSEETELLRVDRKGQEEDGEV